MTVKLLLFGLASVMFAGGVGLVLWEVAKFMARNIRDNGMFED